VWLTYLASVAGILSQTCIGMYAIYHPDYSAERWHVFIGYLIGTWIACSVVLFANKALPTINNFGLFFIIAGVVITILVCAIMVRSDPRAKMRGIEIADAT